jgi:hypothetical protein
MIKDFEDSFIVDGVQCKILVVVTRCDHRKMHDCEAKISFYRSAYPACVNLKSDNGESRKELIKRAFSQLSKEITKTYQNKTGINLDNLLAAVANFRDNKVLSTL